MAHGGMQVELPDALSVLAHELRSPLSVLQGYIRLLQRERTANDPEFPMLTAMLEATGRLAALGRQASDLAMFLRPASNEAAATTLGALLDEVARRAPAGVTIATAAEDVRQRALPRTHRDLLAASLCALAELVMRETGHRTATIAAASRPGGVRVSITAGAPADASPVDDGDGSPVVFTSGGLGLSLVVASYVLAALGADASRMANGRIRVDLGSTDETAA